VLSPDKMGALIRSTWGTVSVRFDDNGKIIPIEANSTNILRQIPPVFVIDSANHIKARSDTNLNRALPAATRFEVEDSYSMICRAIEAATIGMPNRTVKAGDTFPLQSPMMIKSGKKPLVVDLDMIGTMQGTRKRGDRQEALVSLVGKVKGRDELSSRVGGDITGKLAFDIAGGFLSQVQLRIGSEVESQGNSLVTSFDVNVARVAGNPDGLPQPTIPKGGGTSPPDLSKGKIVYQQPGVLLPNDQLATFGALAKATSRMKMIPLQFQANKKYVITLTSTSFDAYLVILDAAGKTLAEDDDSAGNLNAQIQITPPQAGIYRVVVGAFDAKTGPFALQIVELP